MAILTNRDLRKYLKPMRKDPASKAAMDADPMTRAQLLAMLQGMEDWFETNRAAAKAAMVAGAGKAMSNALARKVGRAWMQIKFGGE